MKQRLARLAVAAALAIHLLALPACATLGRLAGMALLEFFIDRVMNVRLAGVELDRIRSYGDLGVTDVARIGAAVASRELPLEFDLLLVAENPVDNDFTARLTRLDWTLHIQEQETIDGVLRRTFELEPGEPRDIVIPMRLDLFDYFGGNAREMVDLVLWISGEDGPPRDLVIEALPVVETPLGPLRYPGPIEIRPRERT